VFGQIQSAGNTVVLVTHEEDIAAYSKRIVRLRDGVIESDTPKSPKKDLIMA
jgi:putative ABC transport system ATP-binding protein